ncbi:MAG: efflux RND transporter periplasmic adaptor subunit [Acidobacteriota bacterium]|nr:efflux RND transporter periplasmic adaptor subunit [Acidobacteriota bacterium]
MYFHRQPGCFSRFALIAAVAGSLAASPACNRSGALTEAAGAGVAADPVRGAVGNQMESLRLIGTVEAVRSQRIAAPTLAGQAGGNMVATKIVPNGSRVRAGDVLVEFDLQTQTKNILDRQAEYDSLVQQIQRRQAEQAATLASDETELKGAEVDMLTARVEMRKNDVVPQYQAEINRVNLAEAEAKYKQLNETLELKREARAADLRILEIQRDRAKLAADYAGNNIEKMTLRSPMDGLVVLSQITKGTRQVYPQAGDEFRAGGGMMMVVDTAHMQVAAIVNQVDIAEIYVGQTAEVHLDAYPELVFPGRVEQISPTGTSGEYSKRIRLFSIIVSIGESHPKLLPDLTASVDLPLERATHD